MLDETYWHDHPKYPPAGLNSAKAKSHSLKKFTFGKQFDNQEPSFFVNLDSTDIASGQRFENAGRGENRHGEKLFAHARIDPSQMPQFAGSTSRVVAKHEQARIKDVRPGDAWENNVGAARRLIEKEQLRGGRPVAVPIDSMQRKAKGQCNYYNEAIDPITHTDTCDWKRSEKARIKKTCGMRKPQRPWSSEAQGTNERELQCRIAGLPNRVFVAVSGERKLHICGAEDLGKISRAFSQDLVPSREHIKRNDVKYLATHAVSQWDQIDGPGQVRKPLRQHDSTQMMDLMNRYDMDECPVGNKTSKSVRTRANLKEAARSQSMEAAGRSKSDMAHDERHHYRRPTPQCAWAESNSSVPSDSMSSMPQRCHENIRSSHSARGGQSQRTHHRSSHQATTTPRRDGGWSDIAASDTRSQRSMSQSHCEERSLPRSQSARRPRASREPIDDLHSFCRSLSARNPGRQLRKSPQQGASCGGDSCASARSVQGWKRSSRS